MGSVSNVSRPSLRLIRRRLGSAEGRLFALVAVILLALWGTIAFGVALDRRQSLGAAQAELTNLSLAFSEHAAKTIQGADQAIRFVRESLHSNPGLRLRDYVSSNTVIDSDFRQLSITDRDGWLIDSTLPFRRIDLSDREHIRIHANRSVDQLFVSKPVIGRVSKKASIQVTRGIWQPDGGFQGVIVASLAPELLTRYYSEVELGRDGVVAMVGRDGTVRVRSAKSHGNDAVDVSRGEVFAYMKEHESGSTVGTSVIDGVERLYAFHWVANADIATVVARSVSEIEAPARRRAVGYVGAGVVMTGLILAFALSIRMRIAGTRKLVQQLREAKRDLYQALQLRRTIFSNFAHELRTPLNGVVGAMELLTDCDEAARGETEEVLRQSVGSLRRLVQRMIDYAEIESGRVRYQAKPVRVDDVARDLCMRLSDAAAARGVLLSFASDGDRPPVVIGDPWRLFQALSYLIEAALETSTHGTITLRVFGDGPNVKTTVVGSGGAMDDTIWNWASTTRLETQTEEGLARLRLALPLAAMLLVGMNGAIEAEMQASEQTRVTLTMPAATIGT